jgi:tetratricopeptide (TPR) repeat protein
MSKIGRNEPCPCGSGKKHKKCCYQVNQAPAGKQSQVNFDSLPARDYDSLDDDSNRILDLIKQNKIDLAEQKAKNLIEKYPEVQDGFERLGMVYEAKKQNQLAVDMYQKALDFTIAHPENGYEEEFKDWYREKIKKLTLEENEETTAIVKEFTQIGTTIPANIRETIDKVITATKEVAGEYQNQSNK